MGGLPRPTFVSAPAPPTKKAKGTTSARQGSNELCVSTRATMSAGHRSDAAVTRESS
jgi:hypothetical protein